MLMNNYISLFLDLVHLCIGVVYQKMNKLSKYYEINLSFQEDLYLRITQDIPKEEYTSQR